MPTPSTNFPGRRIGALKLLAEDKARPRCWLVRWTCCGREQSVHRSQIAAWARTQPSACKVCRADDPLPVRRGGEGAPSGLGMRGGVLVPGVSAGVRGAGWWPVLGGWRRCDVGSER